MGWGNGGLEEGWELSVCLQQDLAGAAQTPPKTAAYLVLLWFVPAPAFLSFSTLDSELCYLCPWHQHPPAQLAFAGCLHG